jgi:hypothetical protein
LKNRRACDIRSFSLKWGSRTHKKYLARDPVMSSSGSTAALSQLV